MAERCVILHLSDLQFGAHHRFAGCVPPDSADSWTNARYTSNDAFQTLASKLQEDLAMLSATFGLVPNILVISGDIAEWGIPDEYREARLFLDALLAGPDTHLSRERIVLVPGNHDVNWDLSEAYFSLCKGHRKTPQFPCLQKFECWNEFVRALNPDTELRQDHIWHPYDFRELGILLVGLNSCLKESHLEQDHYGWIGLQQANEMRDWFDHEDRDHALPHVAVVHHNVMRGSHRDDENLRDWDDVRTCFMGTVDLILHGHRHEHHSAQLGALQGAPTVVLGTGSAELDAAMVPDSPNQYQLIAVVGGEGTLWLRTYRDKVVGRTGKGQFVADADPSGTWEYGFQLPAVTAAELHVEKAVTAERGGSVLPQYIDAMQSSIAQRLLREQEKVGMLVPLSAHDLRHNRRDPLGALLSDWPSSLSSQLVILSAAGSGKTLACLELCRGLLAKEDQGAFVPLYLDLGRHSGCDDALDIIREAWRDLGISLDENGVLALLREKRWLFVLDSFDEYEKAGFAKVSDRSFLGFDHFQAGRHKVLVACRSNFFQRPEEIFIYDVPPHRFELCPSGSIVLEIEPVDPETIRSILGQYFPGGVPSWLIELADRPLYLRMLVPLLRTGAIDPERPLQRHQLYEQFVSYCIKWDCSRSAAAHFGVSDVREFHVTLAKRFLGRSVASLAHVELHRVVEEHFRCSASEARFSALVSFVQESALLRFEAGRIVFTHKSLREYLIARQIFDLIAVGDDTFEFTWFTRNERDFIVEMLTEGEKTVLCRWLANEERYPACNYAAFILGGTRDRKMIGPLRARLLTTNDALVQLNCSNALAGLGDRSVRARLMGAVAGYLLDRELATIPPPGCDSRACEWVPTLEEKFGKEVMLIHLCECVDALAMCGDETAIGLIGQLQGAPDKSVADEARGAMQRLKERLTARYERGERRRGNI